MDAAARELLTSTIVYRPRTGSDKFDAPTYGDPTSLPARVVEEVRELRTRDNRIVVTRGFAILGEEAAAVEERGQVEIDGRALDALAVSKPRDIDGTLSHVKVWF